MGMVAQVVLLGCISGGGWLVISWVWVSPLLLAFMQPLNVRMDTHVHGHACMSLCVLSHALERTFQAAGGGSSRHQTEAPWCQFGGREEVWRLLGAVSDDACV